MKLFEIAQAFDEITNGGIFVDVYEGDGEVILTYDELRSYLMQGNVRDEKILSDAESRILFDRIVAVGSDDECGDRIDEIIASVLLVLCVMARRAFSISDYGNQSEAVEMIYRGFAGEFEEQMYAFGSPFLIQYGRTTFVSIVIEKEAADAIRSMVHLSIGPGSLMPHKGFVCPVKNSDFVDVKTRNGHVTKRMPASECQWNSRDDDDYVVVAYRLSRPFDASGKKWKPEGVK